MKKITCMLLMAALIVSLTACGGENSTEETTETVTTIETADAEETAETEQVSEDPEETEETKESSEASLFAEVAGWQFWFGSGAGGWRTIMYVNEDGSFTCDYTDSEMGDSDEEYPDGSVYYANVTGQFTEPEQINDYTYCVQIESMTYETEPGAEEIDSDIRYISAECYGIEDGEDFYFYTPDAPVDELPEEYLSWVMSTGIEEGGTLGYYGFYNVNAGNGFSSYEPDDEDTQTDETFLRTAGLWRRDGAEDTASIYMDGTGYYEAYYASGSVESTGYLEYVDEYDDGNGRYDMYDFSGDYFAGFYFDSDTQFHIDSDDEVVYILNES